MEHARTSAGARGASASSSTRRSSRTCSRGSAFRTASSFSSTLGRRYSSPYPVFRRGQHVKALWKSGTTAQGGNHEFFRATVQSHEYDDGRDVLYQLKGLKVLYHLNYEDGGTYDKVPLSDIIITEDDSDSNDDGSTHKPRASKMKKGDRKALSSSSPSFPPASSPSPFSPSFSSPSFSSSSGSDGVPTDERNRDKNTVLFQSVLACTTDLSTLPKGTFNAFVAWQHAKCMAMNRAGENEEDGEEEEEDEADLGSSSDRSGDDSNDDNNLPSREEINTLMSSMRISRSSMLPESMSSAALSKWLRGANLSERLVQEAGEIAQAWYLCNKTNKDGKIAVVIEDPPLGKAKRRRAEPQHALVATTMGGRSREGGGGRRGGRGGSRDEACSDRDDDTSLTGARKRRTGPRSWKSANRRQIASTSVCGLVVTRDEETGVFAAEHSEGASSSWDDDGGIRLRRRRREHWPEHVQYYDGTFIDVLSGRSQSSSSSSSSPSSSASSASSSSSSSSSSFFSSSSSLSLSDVPRNIAVAPAKTCSNIRALRSSLTPSEELTAFAARAFQKNEPIMLYGGELVANDDFSTVRPYRVALGGGFAVDAAKMGNETRAINSVFGVKQSSIRANICFKSRDNNIWVVALHSIPAGEVRRIHSAPTPLYYTARTFFDTQHTDLNSVPHHILKCFSLYSLFIAPRNCLAITLFLPSPDLRRMKHAKSLAMTSRAAKTVGRERLSTKKAMRLICGTRRQVGGIREQ